MVHASSTFGKRFSVSTIKVGLGNPLNSEAVADV